jgi:hypothetical protein
MHMHQERRRTELGKDRDPRQTEIYQAIQPRKGRELLNGKWQTIATYTHSTRDVATCDLRVKVKQSSVETIFVLVDLFDQPTQYRKSKPNCYPVFRSISLTFATKPKAN